MTEDREKINATQWATYVRVAPRNMQRYLNGSRGMPIAIAAEFVSRCATLDEAKSFLKAVADARRAYTADMAANV